MSSSRRASGQYRLLYSEVLAQRTSSPTRVRWEGPQLVNHSLALVNRQLELALLKTGKVELTITPTAGDTFSRALNSRARCCRHITAAHSRVPLKFTCAISGPPNWTAPAEGRWVVIQPWEYGAVPEDWVGPINREVDELWAPSSFVRNLYIRVVLRRAAFTSFQTAWIRTSSNRGGGGFR